MIRLDTPGGLVELDGGDRQAHHRLEGAGDRLRLAAGRRSAASAGTFITYASHVAAMAPGTEIGSATPIDASGGDIEGDLGNKVKEDAAAKIRALAELRGRNAELGRGGGL